MPTERELAVLEAVARTGSYRGAAIELDLAESTVKNTLRTIHLKLGSSSTLTCYRVALSRGIIRSPA